MVQPYMETGAMRARNIKPGFYKNEELADCSPWSRLLAPGLWMLADKEGRMYDRPKRIKAEIFPYDNVEIEQLLEELVRCRHILRYEVDGRRFIQVLTFSDHQRPHSNETKSLIPPHSPEVPIKDNSTSNHGGKSFQPREEALRSDSLIPSSLKPDSLNEERGKVASLPVRAVLKKALDWPDDDPENLEGYILAGSGFRLTEKWVLPEKWGDWAMEDLHLKPDKILSEAQSFKDYFTGPDAKKPIKQDWQSAWKIWIRKSYGIQKENRR